MRFEEQIPLSRFTTVGTGGPARWFARPESVEELSEALGWAADRGVNASVVGLGSNLLVADEGVDGLVLKLTGDLAAATVEGERLLAGGGAPLAVCLHRARAASLGGLEFACAIPGTVGGGVWAINRIREGIGVPVLSVLVTTAFWYIGDASWNSVFAGTPRPFSTVLL